MLYELADEDWEEPLPGESSTEAANGEAMDAQDGWTAAGLSTPPRPRNPGSSPELHVGKPFMSAPSPLKLQPSQESVASMSLTINSAPAGPSVTTPPRDRTKVCKVVGATRVDGDVPNTQLSRPKNMNAVPLPPPPRGFRFRPILPEGHEVVVTLSLVSGRYYPRLLAHPMLRPIVRDMEGHVNEAAARLDGHHLFALEGILPGFFNASEATQWKPGRSVIVRDTVAERSAMLARMWDVRRQQFQQAVSPAAPEPEPAVGAADVEQSSQGQGQGQEGQGQDQDQGQEGQGQGQEGQGQGQGQEGQGQGQDQEGQGQGQDQGQGQGQGQEQEQEQGQEEQGQEQEQDKDVTMQQSDSEAPAPAVGILASTDAQAGPRAQSVPAA